MMSEKDYSTKTIIAQETLISMQIYSCHYLSEEKKKHDFFGHFLKMSICIGVTYDSCHSHYPTDEFFCKGCLELLLRLLRAVTLCQVFKN